MAKPGLLVVLLAAVLLTGCAHAEESSIAPLTPTAGRVDPGLGPGTRALSYGPGYKGSPSWSPDGTRIAFTVDGYVVDRPTTSGELEALDHEGFRSHGHGVDLGRHPDDPRRGVPLGARGGEFPVPGDCR